MKEPFLIRDHACLRWAPESDGKQAFIDCDNGFGLSMVWAKGDRFEHGLYCGEETYEIALIEFDADHENHNFVLEDLDEHWRLVDGSDVLGWQTASQVGQIIEEIESRGSIAWPRWLRG